MKKRLFDESALENIRGGARSYVDGVVDGAADYALGDSPIEQLFYIGLAARIEMHCSEYHTLWDVHCAQEEAAMLAHETAQRSGVLIIRPQASIPDGWRVDFLIHAYNMGRNGPVGWRKLIVECDGHDFHERTKQQAAKDRGRDRWATLNRFTILRFTGSELYKEAFSCASQVTDWAAEGLL